MNLFGVGNPYTAVVTPEGEIENEQSSFYDKYQVEKRASFIDNSKRRGCWLHSMVVIILLGLLCVLLSIDIALRYPRSDTYCNQKFSVSTPLLKASSASRTNVFFNNSLTSDGSPWRQGPNEVVDSMWESVINERLIIVTDENVRQLGKDPSSFRRVPASLRPKYGDNIIAGTEFSHHIHCLNMIRKFTYFEHYRDMPSEFDFYNAPMKLVRTHTDHCIDTLRQVLMCHPDEGVYLTYWIEGRKGPMADFNTMHKCKDFNGMMDWAERNGIQEELSEYPVEGEMVWTRKHHP